MTVNTRFYPLSPSFSAITSMSRDMERLELQLASGKRQGTLAEFGKDRLQDLSLRARLSRIEGYTANIKTVENRLSFANTAIERLDAIEAETRDLAVPSAYGSDGLNMVNASKRAEVALREVIDLLNTDMAGRYIFGGEASDKAPVTAYDTIMKGAAGKDGFEQVALERRFADAGVAGRGRLTVNDSGTGTVTLAEDGSHPFGLKLSTASGGGGFATVSSPTGSPAGISVTFTGTPKAGDTITVGITYPDDRNRIEYVTLTATADSPPKPGEFTIGADPAATAAGFANALGDTIDGLVGSKLASASTVAAADDFFATGGDAPRRVVFADPADPFAADPVALVADTAHADTVRWYTGQSGADARGTVSIQIDDATKVRVGATADESGFAALIKSLASMASANFSSTATDTEADKAETRARFDAMADIVRVRLSEDKNTTLGSIESIALEMGLASSTADATKKRHAQYGAQLQTLLADIEHAPIEEVAMQLLTLQTRLQASFQATTMISQLSLVNFLR